MDVLSRIPPSMCCAGSASNPMAPVTYNLVWLCWVGRILQSGPSLALSAGSSTNPARVAPLVAWWPFPDKSSF